MLTLQELKQVVGNREERRKVPSARYLRENDVAVVKQRLIDGAEIIAYQTGYVFYCAGDYGTVFPLFTCRDYVYEAGRKITVVKEDFFDNQPWYVRLILEGEDRLCRNREVREHNNCISYDVDTYEYNDTVENREEQVEKLTEDILNKKTETIKDWLLEVSEESDIDSDVITARSLLSRLEDTERFSIFDKQPEQEQPEATISFYVAECMEFPVMGEYHNNLTLEEAIKIYESIPAERLHGIKGIGFDLQDGDENYSGEYELMSADRIRRDLIDMIPHYKESPLVQKAIADMEKYLDEKHGRVKETEHTTETVIGSGQKPSAVAADRRAEQEPVSVNRSQPQKAEPASRAKGEVKKSVLQSLKDFQARAKAQEQNKTTEKSKTHKKGEVEL